MAALYPFSLFDRFRIVKGTTLSPPFFPVSRQALRTYTIVRAPTVAREEEEKEKPTKLEPVYTQQSRMNEVQ
jgi:hypothetical protein